MREVVTAVAVAVALTAPLPFLLGVLLVAHR